MTPIGVDDREAYRKQMTDEIRADIQANKRQKIREVANEEKILQDTYYRGASLDKQYCVPPKFDRFADSSEEEDSDTVEQNHQKE